MKLPDHWFFGEHLEGELYTFSSDEGRHATKVLRLNVGDVLQWVDGKGNRIVGVLNSINRSGMQAQANTILEDPIPSPLTLAVGALHDASRLEWLIEKATELGVTSFLIVKTDRVERTKYRINRLESKALAAMKQSGGAYLPSIETCSFQEVLAKAEALAAESSVLLAHCYENLPRTAISSLPLKSNLFLMIGPEGDFTKNEVELAIKIGAVPIALGQRRLRTETAAIAAVASLVLGS